MRQLVRVLVKRDFAGVVSSAAVKWGVTQAYVSDLLAGKKGAGMKLLSGIAAQSGLTFDQILGRAPIEPPPVVFEPVDRYANRTAAVTFARIDGVDERAVDQLLSIQHHSAEDPPAQWWLDQLRAIEARLRFEQKDPGAVAHEREARKTAVDLAREEDERFKREARERRLASKGGVG